MTISKGHKSIPQILPHKHRTTSIHIRNKLRVRKKRMTNLTMNHLAHIMQELHLKGTDQKIQIFLDWEEKA